MDIKINPANVQAVVGGGSGIKATVGGNSIKTSVSHQGIRTAVTDKRIQAQLGICLGSSSSSTQYVVGLALEQLYGGQVVSFIKTGSTSGFVVSNISNISHAANVTGIAVVDTPPNDVALVAIHGLVVLPPSPYWSISGGKAFFVGDNGILVDSINTFRVWVKKMGIGIDTGKFLILMEAAVLL
jgi:hypothetical protein